MPCSIQSLRFKYQSQFNEILEELNARNSVLLKPPTTKALMYKTCPTSSFVNKMHLNSHSNPVCHPWVANAKRLRRQLTQQSGYELPELLNPALQRYKEALAHSIAPAEVL